MSLNNFEKAIEVAREQINRLVPEATNPTLEEIVISDDEKLYEVTFSYDIPAKKGLFDLPESNIAMLANLLRQRREYKIFLVDTKRLTFRGFRKYKEK